MDITGAVTCNVIEVEGEDDVYGTCGEGEGVGVGGGKRNVNKQVASICG
jgi:hypothetical protein